MSLYEDLKRKVKESGFMSLNGDQRKQYSKFKKENEEKVFPNLTNETAPTEEAPKEEPKEEPKVELTKSELEKMINDGIENFRKHQPDQGQRLNEFEEIGEEEEKNRTALLRRYQKDTKSPYGIIIRADYLKTVWNEETHKHDKTIYEMEVFYDDGRTEVLEIDAMDYVKLNQTERVELIEVDRKKMRAVSGKVGVPIKDKDGYPIIKMDSGGYGSAKGIVGEVDLEVIRYEENFTIRRPNGQELKIHSKYLNA